MAHLLFVGEGDKKLTVAKSYVHFTAESMARSLKPKCILCNKDAPKKCSRCHISTYCGKTHQAEDWPRHKTACTHATRQEVEAATAATAGVPADLFKGVLQEWENPKYKEFITALPVPIGLSDRVAWLVRNMPLNSAYESRGTVGHDNRIKPAAFRAYCKRYGNNHIFGTKKAYLAQLEELTRKYCILHNLPYSQELFQGVQNISHSFHWKRAKGRCQVEAQSSQQDGLEFKLAKRDLVFFASRYPGEDVGQWYDITFSFQGTQQHVLSVMPQPAQVEGVTPLTGKEHKRRRYRKNKQEKQPGS